MPDDILTLLRDILPGDLATDDILAGLFVLGWGIAAYLIVKMTITPIGSAIVASPRALGAARSSARATLLSRIVLIGSLSIGAWHIHVAITAPLPVADMLIILPAGLIIWSIALSFALYLAGQRVLRRRPIPMRVRIGYVGFQIAAALCSMGTLGWYLVNGPS